MQAKEAASSRGAGLRLSGLSKMFGSFAAVDNVDLEVRRGEFLTLLGPSGSGKTTLLMMIAGFLDPSRGNIGLDGRMISDLAPEKRNFGMVFQGYALFPHMTVRGNVAYPLEVRGKVRTDIDRRVDKMLELVQLEPFAGRYPRQLSGGQQQRVALARALSFGPEVLLLDEPLGALDKKLRGDVQEQLKDIHRRLGTTFVYVTHDQEEALSMSDRVVIMNLGRIVQIGTPSELYERPKTVFAADFLGKSNFIKATVEAASSSTLTCRAAEHRLAQKAPADAPAPGDAIELALRPEKIEIATSPKGATVANVVESRIKRLTYFGAMLEITADAGALGQLTVQIPAWRREDSFEIEQTVWLHWLDDAAVIVTRPENQR
ncbi:MAG: ABC transporter ATP-binding protein [Geminicoccaceae bacterium]